MGRTYNKRKPDPTGNVYCLRSRGPLVVEEPTQVSSEDEQSQADEDMLGSGHEHTEISTSSHIEEEQSQGAMALPTTHIDCTTDDDSKVYHLPTFSRYRDIFPEGIVHLQELKEILSDEEVQQVIQSSWVEDKTASRFMSTPNWPDLPRPYKSPQAQQDPIEELLQQALNRTIEMVTATYAQAVSGETTTTTTNVMSTRIEVDQSLPTTTTDSSHPAWTNLMSRMDNTDSLSPNRASTLPKTNANSTESSASLVIQVRPRNQVLQTIQKYHNQPTAGKATSTLFATRLSPITVRDQNQKEQDMSINRSTQTDSSITGKTSRISLLSPTAAGDVKQHIVYSSPILRKFAEEMQMRYSPNVPLNEIASQTDTDLETEVDTVLLTQTIESQADTTTGAQADITTGTTVYGTPEQTIQPPTLSIVQEEKETPKKLEPEPKKQKYLNINDFELTDHIPATFTIRDRTPEPPSMITNTSSKDTSRGEPAKKKKKEEDEPFQDIYMDEWRKEQIKQQERAQKIIINARDALRAYDQRRNEEQAAFQQQQRQVHADRITNSYQYETRYHQYPTANHITYWDPNIGHMITRRKPPPYSEQYKPNGYEQDNQPPESLRTPNENQRLSEHTYIPEHRIDDLPGNRGCDTPDYSSDSSDDSSSSSSGRSSYSSSSSHGHGGNSPPDTPPSSSPSSSDSEDDNQPVAPAAGGNGGGIPPRINAITSEDLDDFDDLTLSDLAHDGEHLTMFKQKLSFLKNQMKLHEIAIETIQATNPLRDGEIYRDDVQAILDTNRERIQRIEQQIATYKDKIQHITDTQQKFKSTIPIPEDTGRDVRINYKDLTLAVPHCTTNGHMSNFAALTKKLFGYGTVKKYSHNNYKQALQFLIDDLDMLETLESMKNDTLDHIIDEFKDRYVSPKTIADSSHKLNNFVRKAGEGIRSAVSRFTQLIHETQDLYQPHQQRTRKELEIEKLLFNVSSPKAAARLRQMKAKAQKYAQIIPTSQYIDAAEEAEDIFQDRPKYAVHNVPFDVNAKNLLNATAETVEETRPPLLTGGNTQNIPNKQPATSTTGQPPRSQSQADSRPPRRRCRKCGSDDPQHVWATCDAIQSRTISSTTGDNRKNCYNCGGTHKHTWRTCSGDQQADQGHPVTRTPRMQTLGKPCYKCQGRHLHNWNTCTATPVNNAVTTKEYQPCNRCGSTMLHNWKTCQGTPPIDPAKAAMECFKCGSSAFHQWTTCTGIPPHLLNDPEVQAMSSTPATTFAPRNTPRKAKECFKCGQTYPHIWNTCTNKRPGGSSQPTYTPGPRRMKPCPFCSSQSPHNWNACKAMDALNQ